jgi:acetate---CoA ligase (ADP-forming)
MLTDALAAVFEPHRVALVGASDRAGAAGQLLWRNLASFPGEVVPVARGVQSVGGRPAYQSLRDVPCPVDLAVIAVPAAAVPDVIADAAAAGVRAAVVISGGFAETGPAGAALQERLLAAARAGGIRVVGPNCLGVQNCDLPLNASLAAGTPPSSGAGGISLVTQSGAYGMAIHTVGVDEGTRFAKLYAAGNKADIGDAELLTYLGRDPATRTVCFFVESLPDGRYFGDIARQVTPRKPVIVARTGRSGAGSRAAASHTAALAGSARVARDVLARAGVVLARSGLEMLDAAAALDTQPPPAGPRVGIVTNSGGTGVELTDLLADEGLDVPELSPGLQKELAELLPPYASARNPVDITPVWSRFTELYPALVEWLARSGEVDAVVPILLQRSADRPVAEGVRDAVQRLRADAVPVPVYVCWVGSRSVRRHAAPLQETGVPCFEWPQRTARAVGHAVRYGASRRGVRTAPVAAATRPASLPALPDGWLAPDTAARLLAAFGVPTVASRLCATATEAVPAAYEVGYPVVAKAVHPELLHKSDVGAVRLSLADPAAVREAAEELLALWPSAGLLVQRLATGMELVVGAVRDQDFGPVVMAGLGGVHVEVLDDVAFAAAPLSGEDATALLARLRGHELLSGARGREPVDLTALAALLRGVGDLVTAVPEVAEVDLNPVLVDAYGAVAVDWRVKVRNLPCEDQAGRQDSPCHAGETNAERP